MDISCKLLILGAGPGGYIAAIRAGQLGIDTIIVDKQKPGGTCLNVGCIPSKALIHAADEFHKATHFASDNALGIKAGKPQIDFAKTQEWKSGIVAKLNSGVAGLMKRVAVKSLLGTARFLDGKTVSVKTDTGDQIIHAENIIIATGSVPVELPFLKFGGNVLSSTEALALTEVPTTLAIVGGGYIGLEIGTAFAKLGAKVTIVEGEKRILPQYDADLTRPVKKRLSDLGITVLTNAKAKGLGKDGTSLSIETDKGEAKEIAAEKILVTVGRKPLTEGWGLEEIRLEMDGKFIKIDDKCRTSMRGVYAIGDVTGEPMLAHRASAQGEMVAEIIGGMKRGWDKQAMPAVCFTDPEILSVGLSPDQARAQGIEIKTGSFPFTANGRAMTTEREDGMVRIVARADNHLVLGIQAVGANVSEMINSFTLAIEMGARLEDIAGMVPTHPTQSEAFHEAALKALGHALNV